MTTKDLVAASNNRHWQEQAASRARAQFNDAVLKAREAEMPVARIAELAGVSRQAIYDILNRKGN